MPLRGSQTLFADIFEMPAAEKQRKGRSETLNSQRNECLIDRYYLYGRFYGLRYGLILKILSKEFFLSEITIPQILEDNQDKLSAVKKAALQRAELKKKWPHMDWNPPVMILED